MADPPTLVHSPFALALVQYVRQRSLPLDPWVGTLPPAVGHVPGLELSTAEVRRLAELVARASGEASLGLLLAQAPARGSLGVLEFTARASPDLGAALERLQRYSSLVNPRARFLLEPTPCGVRVVHRIPGDPLALGPHGNAFTLAWLLRFLRQLSAANFSPGEVWLAHPAAPPELASLREAFGTGAVHSGAGENALLLETGVLRLPIASADPALAQVLEAYALTLVPTAPPPQTSSERAALHCRQLMIQGEVPTLDQVARALHASPRTLQRQLAQEGSSFESVLEQQREALARKHLSEGRHSLAEVAYLLGYSEPRALARAFRRWTGTTPSAFRGSGG